MSDNKMSIKTMFKAKQAVLESKLNVLLEHPVTKGDHCESAWIDFFRSFLPSKYAIDKGFVFDASGKISEQIDIIIYDALYSPLIFGTDAGEKFVTAESVYAVFESKPSINKKTLEYANEKIASVVCLSRSSREIINAGHVQPPRELTDIIGGILAVNSVKNITIERNISRLTHIGIGCAIKKTSFVAYRNKERDISEMRFSNKEESILAFFYIVLDSLYKLGTVAAIDMRNYSDETISSLKLLREDTYSTKNA